MLFIEVVQNDSVQIGVVWTVKETQKLAPIIQILRRNGVYVARMLIMRATLCEVVWFFFLSRFRWLFGSLFNFNIYVRLHKFNQNFHFMHEVFGKG